MSIFETFDVTDESRTLPVILLLDTSGSMRDNDKIEVLNDSLNEMIKELTSVDAGHGIIKLTIITFGGNEANLVAKNVPINDFSLSPLSAKGKTPMGHAFLLANELINDRNEIPNQAYRPTIALVSDGMPVPKLSDELDQLLNSERGAKASRFAVAIGEDADREMLSKFALHGDIHKASEAAEIRSFLQFVTNTVLQETLSLFSPDVTAESFSDSFIAQIENHKDY